MSIFERFIYLTVGFMLFSPYGFIDAAWYLAQFLIYFVLVLVLVRGVLAVTSRRTSAD